MQIKRIEIKNFRNIESAVLNVGCKDIILIGKNGQGKTNILETIYYLCYGSSFRTVNNRELIKNNQNWFFLSSEYEDYNKVPHFLSISFDGKKKLIKMDGKEINDRRQIINNIPCIIFCHDDIEIIKGEPELRRRFFDQTLMLTDYSYVEKYRNYRLILNQRNSLLKSERKDLISLYNEKYIEYGLEIVNERKKVCKKLSDILSELYDNITGEKKDLKIQYRSSWLSDDIDKVKLLEKLNSLYETELKFHTSLSGPHRDKFIITDTNGLFTAKASTGQLRLVSLLLKTAQAYYYRQLTDCNPVYLIDDVLLELDIQTRAAYLNLINYYSQAFYTFLPNENYFDNRDCKSDTKIFNVEQGKYFEK